MAHLFNTGMRNRDRLTVQTMGFANGGSHENAVQERDQAHSCLCSARRRGACAERVRREGLAAQAAACGLARGNRAGNARGFCPFINENSRSDNRSSRLKPSIYSFV